MLLSELMFFFYSSAVHTSEEKRRRKKFSTIDTKTQASQASVSAVPVRTSSISQPSVERRKATDGFYNLPNNLAFSSSDED